MLSQFFHVLPKALALPDVMITVKRYFDRSATSTLIELLLFGLGHLSNILSDTQDTMVKKKGGGDGGGHVIAKRCTGR